MIGVALFAALAVQPFEFMGIVAGEEIPPKAIMDCREQDDGSQWCHARSSKVAGVATGYPLVIVYNGKLNSLVLSFYNDDADFLAIRTALETKYGPPCEVRTDIWQNRMGTELENPLTIWCFSTGKLTMRRFSTRVTQSDLIYIDEVNVLPQVEPVIDF